jgi:multiple sugar transport system permease protein
MMMKLVEKIKNAGSSPNERGRVIRGFRGFLLGLFRFAVIFGISYVILSPLLWIFAKSFFSNADNYSPVIYLIPRAPTLERYWTVLGVLDYLPSMMKLTAYVSSLAIIQFMICSFTAYGFARYNFPLKKILFPAVILIIVIPPQNLILPLYVTFRQFNPLGIITLLGGQPVNMLKTVWPMYIMTIFGCGLRSGLYIYIFIQFFRGLPKEIEEAAFVDGLGPMGTYFRVMLPNAVPAAVTVTIFSLVWQYNDMFFSNIFLMPDSLIVGKRVSTLAYSVSQLQWAYPQLGLSNVNDPGIAQLYVYAGVILLIIPLIVIYALLQKRFIEGVERSGIVG